MDQVDYRYQSYHERKAQAWLQIITECKTSGMTVEAWCNSHNINPKSYWRWHKRLKDECILTLNESVLLDTNTVAESI